MSGGVKTLSSCDMVHGIAGVHAFFIHFRANEVFGTGTADSIGDCFQTEYLIRK